MMGTTPSGGIPYLPHSHAKSWSATIAERATAIRYYPRDPGSALEVNLKRRRVGWNKPLYRDPHPDSLSDQNSEGMSNQGEFGTWYAEGTQKAEVM
jgi:hypothetical protein